ncbi:MAG: hypothetical protein JWP06_514 [Candidatus Saccharibacteria bacterium]|nr:hypothetical protein [Candidatus Saccharibacteria bacterium]
MTDIQTAVALHMEGLNYEGQHTDLIPDDVDVMLRSYEAEDVIAGAMFLVEIMGYDYPDRMVSIEVRLRKIARDIHEVVGVFVDPSLVDYEGEDDEDRLDLVSITFLPYQRGCWTSV